MSGIYIECRKQYKAWSVETRIFLDNDGNTVVVDDPVHNIAQLPATMPQTLQDKRLHVRGKLPTTCVNAMLIHVSKCEYVSMFYKVI